MSLECQRCNELSFLSTCVRPRVSKTDTDTKTTDTDINFSNYPGYTDIRLDGYLAIFAKEQIVLEQK